MLETLKFIRLYTTYSATLAWYDDAVVANVGELWILLSKPG